MGLQGVQSTKSPIYCSAQGICRVWYGMILTDQLSTYLSVHPQGGSFPSSPPLWRRHCISSSVDEAQSESLIDRAHIETSGCHSVFLRLFTCIGLIPTTRYQRQPLLYNTIRYNTKFVQRHVAVASETLTNRTVKKHKRRRKKCALRLDLNNVSVSQFGTETGIIDVGVDACGILSRSVGQTNRKQKYGRQSG